MFSSKLSVGVHILALLACRRGEPLTSEFIACSVHTNPVVIRRLLGVFRAAGYVESKNGVGGGWALVADPKDITLLNVLETLEPRNAIFGLHRFDPNPACFVSCNIQGILTDIYADVRQAIADRLSRSNIEGILGELKKQASA